MSSHGGVLFSMNKRYDEMLQMEEERLRLLKIRAGNRILRQSTQLFEDLILLHVRTPSAGRGADQAERFEVGKVSSTMAFRPRKFPHRPSRDPHSVNPTVEVVGNDAFCMYNNQVHSRRKLPLDTKTRILIERSRKVSRNIENIHAAKKSQASDSDPGSEAAPRPVTLANLPFIPQGGLLSLTAPKDARVRYRKPERRRKGGRHLKFGAVGAVAMAGEIFGDLGSKRLHRTVAGLPPNPAPATLPLMGFRRARTTV